MSDDEFTVLLVEDNDPDATYIEELFVDLNPSLGALDGATPRLQRVQTLGACVERLDTGDIDVVLLDLNLPDSRDLDTIDSVLDTTTDEAVVVLTGLEDEELGSTAVERGAQDYLPKGEVTTALLGRTIKYAVERQRRQRTLEQRNEELRLLNRLVRHDIRDEMALVRGWGKPLEEHVDPAGQEHLDRLLDATDHVIDLTDTVADFLETLTYHDTTTLQPVDVRDHLTAQIRAARQTYDHATFEFEDDAPDSCLVAATDRLASAFQTFLSNAVEHNDTDEPTVTVSLAADTDTVSVTITDDGPGIEPAYVDAVLGRTEQGLAHPDCGVELYLVDTLVDIYDGELTISQGHPRGCTVELVLDRASPESAA